MAGKFLRKMQFDNDVEDMLDTVLQHFRTINEGEGLTPEHKTRLSVPVGSD